MWKKLFQYKIYIDKSQLLTTALWEFVGETEELNMVLELTNMSQNIIKTYKSYITFSEIFYDCKRDY